MVCLAAIPIQATMHGRWQMPGLPTEMGETLGSSTMPSSRQHRTNPDTLRASGEVRLALAIALAALKSHQTTLRMSALRETSIDQPLHHMIVAKATIKLLCEHAEGLHLDTCLPIKPMARDYSANSLKLSMILRALLQLLLLMPVYSRFRRSGSRHMHH